MAIQVLTFGGYSLKVAELSIDTESRLASEDLPRSHGAAADDSAFSSGKIITIRGWIKGASAEALRDSISALSSAFNGGRQALKIFDDRQLWCVKRRLSIIRALPIMAEFSAELFAKDPFLEAVSASTSNGAAPHTPTVSGGGDAPSPPTITLTAPGGGMTAATIANTTTGKTFTWSGGSLTSGQTLVVDMGARTITEGGTEVYTHFSGDFWDLLAGNNTLNITSTPTGATVAISWRARWYD